ncbi:unnamed protein product, partial [Amoebophrya sp. A120]
SRAALHGKKWKSSSSRPGAWELVSDPEALFEVTEFFFCENSGKEEAQVGGVWFQKESDGTYYVR